MASAAAGEAPSHALSWTLPLLCSHCGTWGQAAQHSFPQPMPSAHLPDNPVSYAIL